MKSKKGFTLVELLAVIAILAILVILVLPNVLILFNNSKRNTFETELKSIYEAAEQQWVVKSMTDPSETVFASCHTENCPIKLKLTGRDDIDYYIVVNASGKIEKFYATDGTFQYKHNGILKKEDIKNAERVSDLQSENILKVSCNGVEGDFELAEEGTIYSIIENEALNGSYASIFKGVHKDSFTTNGNKNIYYFTQPSETNGKNVDEVNNVIFANQCWQMIRTTDTGGVKLLFNGYPDSNNTCIDSREPGIGITSISSSSSSTFTREYYYSDSYTYDKSTNSFKLSGNIFSHTYEPSNMSDINTIKGKYTCKSNDQNATCSTLYSILSAPSQTIVANAAIGKSTRVNSFGVSIFNSDLATRSYDSNSYVGFMYNKKYQYNPKNKIRFQYANVVQATIYKGAYFSNEVVWSDSKGCFILKNPTQLNNFNDMPNWEGKFGNGTNSSSTACAHYVYKSPVNTSGNRAFYRKIELGKDQTCTTQPCPNSFFTFGKSYTVNSDGTSTINDPVTVSNVDWLTRYAEFENSYMCKGKSSTCDSLFYVYAPTNYYTMSYYPVYKLGKGVTYSNGKYTLSDAQIYNNLYENSVVFNDRHYTCLNISGICDNVKYIHYYSDDSEFNSAANGNLNYISLSNGEKIEDALNNMYYADNVNTKDSVAKLNIELWYRMNMLNYTDMLEDTIFCGDRTMSKPYGWDPNGGDVSKNYPSYGTASGLECPLVTDQFSVSNQKAKLTYPAALLTSKEYKLYNYNSHPNPGYNNRTHGFWLMTPIYIYQGENGGPSVGVGDYSGHDHVSWSFGLRPVVSVKSGVKYVSGDGSKERPYIIE